MGLGFGIIAICSLLFLGTRNESFRPLEIKIFLNLFMIVFLWKHLDPDKTNLTSAAIVFLNIVFFWLASRHMYDKRN